MKPLSVEQLNKYLKKRIPVLLGIFIIVNIISEIHHFNLLTDILSHFQLQYLFISLIFVILTIYMIFYEKVFFIYAAISIMILFIKIPYFSAFYKPISQITPDEKIKIGLFNVLTSNTDYTKVTQEIFNNSPDIIILQEIDDFWVYNLAPVKKNYPYKVEHIRFDNFGIAIYSKIPIENSQIEKWTELEIPVIKAEFKIDKSEVILYGIHTLPPINNEYLKIRNQMLQKINKISNSTKQKIIIAGDLNTTRFSHAYQEYLQKSNLIDTQVQNKNISGTWNAKHPGFMRISLDRILISPTLVSSNFKIGKDIGSDHLPIFANIYSNDK